MIEVRCSLVVNAKTDAEADRVLAQIQRVPAHNSDVYVRVMENEREEIA